MIMTKETIPSCFSIGYTKYRLIRVEEDRVKTMLLAGDLQFIYLPLAEVLEKAKEVAEPNEKDSTYF